MNHYQANRTRRLVYLIAYLIVAIIWLFAAQGCTMAPSHNANGGYTDACEDLPGLIGDDC